HVGRFDPLQRSREARPSASVVAISGDTRGTPAATAVPTATRAPAIGRPASSTTRTAAAGRAFQWRVYEHSLASPTRRTRPSVEGTVGAVHATSSTTQPSGTPS